MDSDEEHSYVKAMLVITVALAILTTVVAILVAIFPGGQDGDPAPPPTPGATAAGGAESVHQRAHATLPSAGESPAAVVTFACARPADAVAGARVHPPTASTAAANTRGNR